MVGGGMSTRVKICGITRHEDAQVAVQAGAAALGWVFVPGTPRYVSVEHAAAIVQEVPPMVTRVGLFVDADPAWILQVIQEVGLDTIQLHGEESPEFCRQFRGKVKVMKAFRVRGPETVERLSDYSTAADAFLLDAYVPGVAGGTGATFDWTQAVAARSVGRPIILAGGLTPENVAEAVRRVQPFAVDVSSGVEASPGKKDPAKVLRFLQEVDRSR